MTQVPVQITGNVQGEQAFSAEAQKGFEDYFGANPQLVEGSKFFGNSEKEQFLAGVTQTDCDLTGHQPVHSNLPQVNCMLGGKYKVRAVIDSGSTTTLMSTGLLDKMPDIKARLKPTTLGFYGVGEGKTSYQGLLYELEV